MKGKINPCFKIYYKDFTTVNILLLDIKRSLPQQHNIHDDIKMNFVP